MISLGLNLRLDESLSTFDLALEFFTAKALSGQDKLIGTEDDLLDILGADRIPNSGDEAIRFTIPTSIFDALCNSGPGNVAELLELGNRALSGQTPHPATYDELATAIQMVNESFDGGRFCVACD